MSARRQALQGGRGLGMSPTPKPKKADAPKTVAKGSKVNKIFWIVMLFFFISATAYYVDIWIQS